MESYVQFDVLFLTTSNNSHDDGSISSLESELSFLSCDCDEDAEDQEERVENKRRSRRHSHEAGKEQRKQKMLKAPCTPVRQQQPPTRGFRRPSCMGESEGKRRQRLEELCSLVQRDDTVSPLRLCDIRTTASPQQGTSRRGSLRSDLLKATSRTPSPRNNDQLPNTLYYRHGRRLSLPRRFPRVIPTNSSQHSSSGCAADDGSTSGLSARWAGTTNTTTLEHQDSPSRVPRCPQRTLSGNAGLPEPPTPRILPRPSCPSLVSSDSTATGSDKGSSIPEQLRTVCQTVLALTNDDELQSLQDNATKEVMPPMTAPLSARSTTLSSCTSHLTRDLPSKMPRRQRSVEVEEMPSRLFVVGPQNGMVYHGNPSSNI